MNSSVRFLVVRYIDKELLNSNASLAVMPNTDTNHEEMIEFLEEYLKNPGAVWKDAKIDVKIKLQWFQFPQGLSFQNKIFGTAQIASVFKTKDAISASKSAQVDFGVQFWNRFAIECDYLTTIMQEYERDKK